MSGYDDRLKLLETELDALRKIKTQEDYDEGAILHAKHNAPWVKGQYSHLEFPPYVFRAFPKMLYSAGYEAACLEYDQACLIPARGSEEGDRDAAMRIAQRKKDVAVKTVLTQTEEDAWIGRGWFVSPTAAVDAAKAQQREMATVAAHRAYEDRNMGDQAKAEIRAFDDQAEAFVTEIPARQKPGPRKKVGRPKKHAEPVAVE